MSQRRPTTALLLLAVFLFGGLLGPSLHRLEHAEARDARQQAAGASFPHGSNVRRISRHAPPVRPGLLITFRSRPTRPLLTSIAGPMRIGALLSVRIAANPRADV